MNNSQRIKILMESGRTVFTPVDLRLLWQESAQNSKVSALRMVSRGLIVRVANGYYAINDKYNPYELANRIVTPSYVSFHSALKVGGISFQNRTEIGSVSTINYRKKVRGFVYTYAAMKDSLFFMSDGVVKRDGVTISLPERAILDSFYFGFLPDVDNAEKINGEYLIKLSLLYPKTVQKKIKAFL
ncbi:MAG: hypothetical protein HYY63_05485 [Elusimicrobia bacterium]|nr:hypothetical protein [Elusimicrobiota bacterium]